MIAIGLHNASYKILCDLAERQVGGISRLNDAASSGILAQFQPAEVSNPDDILLIVFLLWGAALCVFWLADLWSGAPFRASLRDVWADYRERRAERKAERRARRDVDQNPRVVVRIRDQWEAKR